MDKKRSKNNNILLVANYPSDVGYAWWLMENFWAEISIHFQLNKVDCTLIYPQINTVPDVIKESSINIVEHDFSKRTIISVVYLLRIIRNNNIGYIYLTDKPYYDWLYFLLRIAGVRKIVNHDHTPGERTRLNIIKKFFKKSIHRLFFFSCDYYIGVSKFVQDRAIEVACVPAAKCSFIHNGIKLFDNLKSYYAHEGFDIPKDAKIIVTTGRATYYKGIDLLIKCAHILIYEKNIENLYFLHIGNGPDLPAFKKMANEFGIEDRFIFAGFRQDVPQLLPSCDIGVQVSHGEAFSLSIIEYMHAGLATLAPDNCGNSEAIVDGVNGLLYAPGDMLKIVEKILYLLEDTESCEKISNEARKSVLQNFTLETCNMELVSLLEKQFV